MNHRNKQPATERLALTTHGEIDNWLNNEAVGSSPYTAAYLAKVREGMQYLKAHPDLDDGSESERALYTLAGVIGDKSERRHHAYTLQKAPEIPGLAPVREVTDSTILAASLQFKADHPANKGYEDSEFIWRTHLMIDAVVREEITHAAHQQWQDHE